MRGRDVSRYEVKRLGSNEVTETTATLDFARERAAELSRVQGGWFLVYFFDNGKRTLRSFAVFGRALWAQTCTRCDGRGAYGYYGACDRCNGVGAVEAT